MQFLPEGKIYRAIGLMSGTSLDGVDAAIVETDGKEISKFGNALTVAYPTEFQACLRELINNKISSHFERLKISNELTLYHAEAVDRLFIESGIKREEIDLIGFHGQTIYHAPEHKITEQIGNPALLASKVGVPVVFDFRSADVAAGGQGAPLVPIFHAALAEKTEKPVVFLNIGGVANITYIGAKGELIACDCGPGNAMLNDFVHKHLGKSHDENGDLASAGKPRVDIVAQYLQHPFFAKSLPKSLDRNAFSLDLLNGLDVMTGAATLTNFTIMAVKAALKMLPEMPKHIYVCGGGRHNKAMIRELANILSGVVVIDKLGFNGDALEAQAFAFLAVRCALGFPISFPETTGVKTPTSGGCIYLNK